MLRYHSLSKAGKALTNYMATVLPHAATVLITFTVVIVVVMLHYETVHALGRLVGRRRLTQRWRFVTIILGLLLAHVAEIWVFGVAAWVMVVFLGLGSIVTVGAPEVTGLLDFVYLSTTSFTTVGFGDLAPTGEVRFLFGSESLVGLVLITWSASFTYLEMSRYWRD